MNNIEPSYFIGKSIQSIDVESVNCVKIYFTDQSMIMVPKVWTEPVIYRENNSIYKCEKLKKMI